MACSSSCCEGFLYPGHSALRMHAVPERTGAALMAACSAPPMRAGIAVMTRSAGARTVGATTQAACRRRLSAPGRRGSSGCACDAAAAGLQRLRRQPRWCASCCPRWRDAHLRRPRRQRRQRHRLGPGARRAPGRPRRLPGPRLLGGAAGRADVLGADDGRRRPGQPRGRRFHDETQGYSEAAVQVLAQPGGIAWNVFDDAAAGVRPQLPGFPSKPRRPVRCGSAADAAALAALIGCDAATCATRWTACARAPSQPTAAFRSRADAAVPRRQGHRRAVPHPGRARHRRAVPRAARRTARRSPNLLAAGGAARGVSGNAVWGYLSGNGLLSAVAGGCHRCAHRCRNCWRERKRHDFEATPAIASRAAGARHLRRAECAGCRAGRLRGALPVGRVDRLHAAGPLRRRPDHRQRGGAHARRCITERVACR